MTPMSNSVAPHEVNNSIVCEAIGCYSKATNKITLSVGYKGTISLFLCTNCKSKLSLGQTAEGEILQQENAVNEGEDDA